MFWNVSQLLFKEPALMTGAAETYVTKSYSCFHLCLCNVKRVMAG